MEDCINLRVPLSQVHITDELTPFLITYKDGAVDFGDISEYKHLVIAELTNNQGLVFDDLGTGKDYALVACVRQVKYKELPKPLRKVLRKFANPKPGQTEDSPSSLFRWLGLQDLKGYWMWAEGKEIPEALRVGFAELPMPTQPRTPPTATNE